MSRRRKRLIWIAPLALLAIALFAYIGGEIVMYLWNWLLRHCSAGARLHSGRRLESWSYAGFSSAELVGTVPVAPVFAVVWPIAWQIEWPSAARP